MTLLNAREPYQRAYIHRTVWVFKNIYILEGLNSLVYKSEEGENGSVSELELQWGAVTAARAKQPNR